MARYYYKETIRRFVDEDSLAVLGKLVDSHAFDLEEQQRNAWNAQIEYLKKWLNQVSGTVVFEYSIPRMGRRIDCVILCQGVVFALEFKIGSANYDSSAIDQVVDYALDLKNFHEQSHSRPIVPILICTEAENREVSLRFPNDKIAEPILTNGTSLRTAIMLAVDSWTEESIEPNEWIDSIYRPTPTIVEAAQALYRGHSVEEISRSDAGATNLSQTASTISRIIEDSRRLCAKSICFLTGVPGAGKTLAGLNLANSQSSTKDHDHIVFLSGNGPLVSVLQEALVRNVVLDRKDSSTGTDRKGITRRARTLTRAFIQNVHHFRDESIDSEKAPANKVVIFDEAQRAWTLKQTASFMKVKKGRSGFGLSEPEFLISVMDRHPDWATIVCLVGGGQEINTGEAGILEWFEALRRSFSHWKIHVSSRITDYEYTLGRALLNEEMKDTERVFIDDTLHLSVSVRSFRSEKVAAFVKAVLDADGALATALHSEISADYPMFLTRDITTARDWLRSRARGSERFGIVASSGAIRLKPYGLNVKTEIEPVKWFLNGKRDIRSSYYLEDVATEFDIQGLELDWVCLAWDANLRFDMGGWVLKSFRGTKWQDVKNPDDRIYLKNAYRVLLTRARQGMVIFIPQGDVSDETRRPEFYDGTYDYLKSLGIRELV